MKNDPETGELTPSAHVDLQIVQQNYIALRHQAAGAETGAVVKADCYGHGVSHIAPALAEAGCETFFVAYTHEGQALRALIGPDPTIFVFNGIRPHETDDFRIAGLSPVCNTPEEIAMALTARLPAGYGIHIDTGMNRLGIRPENVIDLPGFTHGFPPRLIMSHLACADQPAHPLNKIQLERFHQARNLFPGIPASLVSTAGIYLGADYTFDLVRPGIGLYGGGPARPPGLKLRTAMTLTAPVMNVFEVKPGETVGYGASFEARGPSVIATVAFGYADGYLRSGGNYGFAILDGVPCPVVGRISMDLITLDVTDLAEKPRIGDRAEFIGKIAGYEIQAEALGTLGYELTSRLGTRISRSWG